MAQVPADLSKAMAISGSAVTLADDTICSRGESCGRVLLTSANAQLSPDTSLRARHWGVGLDGVHAGVPETVAIGFGPMLTMDTPAHGQDPERIRTLFALVEPGLQAGRLSVGYAAPQGNLFVGWSVRGTALRRWHRTGSSYLGAEVSGFVLGMGPRLGLFRQITPGARHPTLVTIDFGIFAF